MEISIQYSNYYLGNSTCRQNLREIAQSAKAVKYTDCLSADSSPQRVIWICD